MKGTTLIKILAITFIAPVLFTSCKSDHVCTCTYTNALGGTSTEKYILDNQTKPDAIDNCENYEKNSAFQTVNCNL